MYLLCGSGFTILTVPFGILQHAVRHGDFNEVKILLLCKALFGNGFNENNLPQISVVSGLHIKTVRKYINSLKLRNWIGLDPGSGRYINRGWPFIRLSVQDKTSVGYSIKRDQLRNFKAFAIAATYDHLVAIQKYKFWLYNRERNKKGTSRQTGLQSKGFYPVANEAYSKIYNISQATASRYRLEAARAGYIELQEHLEKIKVPGIAKDHRGMMNRYADRALVYKNGSYHFQGVTHIRSKIIGKRISPVEKIASIKKGNF